MSVKVGVIGAGYFGQHHARIYSELEEAELVAIVSTDKEKSEELAKKYGCEVYADYRDILHRVDALSIVTPTTTHHKIALDCLRAGKDILIEKPITASVEEADELILESQKRGCIIQVGHLERYNPAFVTATQMIKEAVFVESERLSPFLGRGTDVDVTLDLMIHDVDITLSLIPSQVKYINAVGAGVITDKIDAAKAWLEFENGSVSLITASRLSAEKKRCLKVFQKDSYIYVDYQNCEVRRYFKTTAGVSFDIIRPPDKEPLKEQLRDFISCVREKRRPKVSAIEGRDALRIAIEITKVINERLLSETTTPAKGSVHAPEVPSSQSLSLKDELLL